MKRATRMAVGLGTAVVVVGAGGVAAFGFGGTDPAPPPASSLPPSTAKVTSTTLTSTEKVSGTLGHGTPNPLMRTGQGTVTWLPAAGDVISRGETAYSVDDQAVPAIYGSIPMYRTLKSGVEGNDVKQFEENLRALGYKGFTVDHEFTSATATAVRQWQEDLGKPENGTVQASDVVVVPGEVRVAELLAKVGGPANGQVLTYTGTVKTVTVKLDVAKQHLVSQGIAATVTLPDGKTVPGTVASVGSVATAEPAQQGSSTQSTIEVVVTLADQAAAGKLDAAPVDVTLVSDKRENVLAVPVGALVALAEGGYGVQVLDGDASKYVAVETGMFADGKVEIRGQGIGAGTVVGVPK
ncbi:peptidoglycan-binding domain-containing protein [Kibdelosporangium persicum]|uniref:Efflux RND transporter periplasmic adaptor subunit n=1 Tax=Kibdelosporangium persicum TaxID=2698649 RepID=A0ABX2FDL1_9PSEU|nr:peptidoglycan-binding domain-containing protein [Kibdelosporangium persicum]NRN69367.1 Efflux RND transporter periplasmic adaptor subunit [Kibdelosporangium persicum]